MTNDLCEQTAIYDDGAEGCGHSEATVELVGGAMVCVPCYHGLMESADADFGYTPGEDRSPTEQLILENPAFLPDHEVKVLLAKYRASRR